MYKTSQLFLYYNIFVLLPGTNLFSCSPASLKVPQILKDCAIVFTRLNSTHQVPLYDKLASTNTFVSMHQMVIPTTGVPQNTYPEIPNRMVHFQKHILNCFAYITGNGSFVPKPNSISSSYFTLNHFLIFPNLRSGILSVEYMLVLLHLPISYTIKYVLELPPNFQAKSILLIDLDSKQVYLGTFGTTPIQFPTNSLYFSAALSKVVLFKKMNKDYINQPALFKYIQKKLNSKIESMGHTGIPSTLLQQYSIYNGLFKDKQHHYQSDGFCATYLLSMSLNCTMKNCITMLGYQLLFGNENIFSRNTYHKSYFMHSSYGAQFTGIDFYIVLDSNESRDQYLTNIQAVFAPLSPSVWVAILAAFATVMISSALAKSNVKYLFLWLLASLLEQSAELTHYKRSRTWPLLICWAFFSLLIRNFYTFSMYSHLTKHPDPANLPESVHEAYSSDQNLLRLSPVGLGQKIKAQIERINIKALKKGGLYSKIVQLTNVILFYTQDGLPWSPEYLTNQENMLCLNMSFDSLRYIRKRECDVTRKFVMLYDTNKKDDDLPIRLIQLLYQQQGRKMIVTNKNAAILSSLKTWHVDHRVHYYDQVNRNLESLVESGVLNWIGKWEEIVRIYEIIEHLYARKGLVLKELERTKAYKIALKLVDGYYDKVSVDATEKIMKLRAFLVTAVLSSYLFSACLLVLFIEMFWKRLESLH